MRRDHKPAWPATRTGSESDTLHGQSIADPYRWLEDETAAEVQAWMTAQDDHARSVLAASPEREAWIERLKQVFYFDAVGAPVHRRGRYFYSRKHADKEKTIIYW